MTEVRLAGIDREVLATAPEPDPHDDHGHGGAEAGPADPETVPAVVSEIDMPDPATLVAVSADAAFPAGSSIQVRVLEQGEWSAWAELHIDGSHGPDPGSEEAADVKLGSAPLMTSGATQAQIRIDTPTGTVPSGTQLTMVEAPPSAGDAVLGAQPVDSGGRMSARMAPPMVGVPSQTIGVMPQIITRAQWGADESLRSREPYYTDTVKAGFIHHTASTSSYSEAQAAAQVRAIYAYHTKSLGHSDIDYNFLVDRFGRLYEGRYGGMDRPVLGAHTAGFNEQSFAVVALGNFDTYSPPAADMALMRDAIARLFAWKLGLHGVNPGHTVSLVSAGYIKATKYPKGTVATIPAMSTHQTVNFTACPGRYVQAQVPAIRSLAVAYSNYVIQQPTPAADAFMSGERAGMTLTATVTKALRWRAEVLSPCSTTPIRTFSGSAAGAGTIRVSWDLRTSAGLPVLPATYVIRMRGTTNDRSPVVPVSAALTITPKPGGSWGPCAVATRITGRSPAETSVLWGRATAPSSRVVVLTGMADAGTSSMAAGIAAAPLARVLGAPLLLTPREALAGEVAADITRRAATEVIIVGGSGVVSAEAAATVAALGVTVTRLAGASDAATAVAVAQRMPRATKAILVSPSSSPAHSLAASALAAAWRLPILFASPEAVPEATRSAVRNFTRVTVAAPASLSDATVRAGLGAVSWRRVTGASAESSSTAIGRGHSPTTPGAVILPDATSSWATASLAAAAGRPVLFTGRSALGPGVAAFLGSRRALRTVTTTVPASDLDDHVMGSASRILTPTGARRLSVANAYPEPRRVGQPLTVSARVAAQFADGSWRAAPAGLQFSLQFMSNSSKYYRTVRTGKTSAGRATATVTASTSGRWRIVVWKSRSGSDYVTVTR